MKLELEKAVAVLERTPATLRSLLEGLPSEWTASNEGGETWSPFDVVGHLVHGEKTDWIPRARVILDAGESRPFETFDRFAQFRESEGKTLGELLDEFAALRAENLEALAGMQLAAADFDRAGTHPELGRVTLGELLATWVAHDLDHVVQVSRTMAKQYRDEVGPWRAFISVLR